MLLLPNNCRCSNPSIVPENWKLASASLSETWRIQYYFYPAGESKGKLFVVKAGINKLKTLGDRRAAVEGILKELLHMLQVEGYNPITKQFSAPADKTGLIEALRLAFKKVIIAEDTRSDIRSMLKFFELAADQLNYSAMPVADVRRKHIKAILEQCGTNRKLSPQRYNKYRAYLSLLYTELVYMELVESNYTRELKKQKETVTIRETPSLDQCKRINHHLFAKTYEFWRYMNIFFQSGGRIKELLRVKVKKVNLQQQTYVATILKGRNAREVVRVINDEALPLWKELLAGNPDPEYYLFGRGLVPGSKCIRREQITRRWEVHVKKDLGVTADFYSLKALFLELVAATGGIELAKDLADHKSKLVTMKHYATGEAGREIEKKKRVKVSLIG